MKTLVILVVLAALCVLMLQGLYLGKKSEPVDGRWDNAAWDASSKSGFQIIAKLDAFKSSHGRYPLNLEQAGVIVSEHPAMVGDRVWRYKPSPDGASFELYITSPPGPYEIRKFVYHSVRGGHFTQADI
jgi:hypothetical protein